MDKNKYDIEEKKKIEKQENVMTDKTKVWSLNMAGNKSQLQTVEKKLQKQNKIRN